MMRLKWFVATAILVCIAPVYFIAIMAGTLLDFAGEALDSLAVGVADWGDS